MNTMQKGFTLIELMIVVAIIGILAAIAIPAYTDYTARAKVTEAVGALASAKTSVSEYFTSQGVMPTNAAQAGINTAPAGQYVSAVGYEKTSGTVSKISATLANINGEANGKTVILEGTGDTAKGVSWVCKGGNAPGKFLPANCRGT